MEEVDSIILHFLRRLNIDIGEEVKNICDLPVETIIQAASSCLRTINQAVKVPATLPAGISHRIEVATQIATICKDLGYKNDVGYQTFLYYNETELRQVFMFLIERLPNESKKNYTTMEPANKKALLMKTIKAKIGEGMSSIWIPPCCNGTHQTNFGDHVDNAVSKGVEKKHDITRNIYMDHNTLVQKLVKMQLYKDDMIVNTANKSPVSVEVTESKQTLNHEITESLKELKESTIILRQKLDSLESEKNILDVEYSQAKKLCERAEADFKNVQVILNNIGISELEPEVVDNLLEKVEHNISRLHNKSEEWTSKNLSLKVEIEKLRSDTKLLESERYKCKKALVTLKENAMAMKEEYTKKEELRNELRQNNQKLRSGNKRSLYTKRILEIISNVDKQNMEIKKILDDTRQLQKEINTLEGQLDRCFAIADETLFRDAKRDDQAKKAYKLLALLHSECNTIVSLVNETGTLMRETVDLEDNIKNEKAKRTEDILSKIHSDITKLKEESNLVN